MNGKMEVTVRGRRELVNFTLLKNTTSSRELLVFLPGLGCTLDDVLPALDKPVRDRYAILSFDYLGFGNNRSAGAFVLRNNTRILRRLLKLLGYTRIHLLAHSIGQVPAQSIARNPHVKSITSLEGYLTLSDCILSQKVVDYGRAAFRADGFSFLKAQFAESNEPGLQHYFSLVEARTTPDTYYDYCRDLVQLTKERNLFEQFISLPCSKSYFYGECGNVPGVVEALRQKDIPCHAIPHGGHFFYRDNPEYLAGLLAERLMLF